MDLTDNSLDYTVYFEEEEERKELITSEDYLF